MSLLLFSLDMNFVVSLLKLVFIVSFVVGEIGTYM